MPGQKGAASSFENPIGVLNDPDFSVAIEATGTSFPALGRI
jgi:hypothetical protein